MSSSPHPVTVNGAGASGPCLLAPAVWFGSLSGRDGYREAGYGVGQIGLSGIFSWSTFSWVIW